MTILAFDMTEVIGVSVALIIMIGSALSQALKKKEEGSSAKKTEIDDRPSLDDLAAQRRRELQIASQQRKQQAERPERIEHTAEHRGHLGHRKASPGAGVSGVTMAERIALARQRVAEQSAQKKSPQPRADMEPPRQAEARRAAKEEARQRKTELAQQRRHQAQVRQQQQVQTQASRGRPASHPPAAPTRSALPKRERQSALSKQAASSKPSVAVVEPVSDRPTEGLKLNRHTLRQAVVWKEILDKPIGLRGSDQRAW